MSTFLQEYTHVLFVCLYQVHNCFLYLNPYVTYTIDVYKTIKSAACT